MMKDTRQRGALIEKPRPLFTDEKARQEAYQIVFGHKQGYSAELGKKVLIDLLAESGVNHNAFDKGSDRQTLINMGKQYIGYHLQNILRVKFISDVEPMNEWRNEHG